MAERVMVLTFTPVGAHGSISDSSLSDAAALNRPAGTTKLLIQAFDQNVRFTLDGSEPAAAVGFQLKAGDPPLQIPMSAGVTVKVIEEAASAVLQYQWGL